MKNTELEQKTANAQNTQIQYSINGCTVLVRFPAEGDSTLLSEVKRMMLSAVVKV